MIEYAVLACLVLMLLLATTTNIALRLVSRARFIKLLEHLGRQDSLEHPFRVRDELARVAAMVRTALVTAMALFIVYLLQDSGTFDEWLGDHAPWARFAAAFLLSTLAALLFAVAPGNAWARYGGEAFLTRAVPVAFFLRTVSAPLLSLLRGADRIVRRLLGAPAAMEESDVDELEREILAAIRDGTAHGAVDVEEQEMLESIIEFRDTDAANIMTPRTDMVAVESTTTIEALRHVVAEAGHSRIPVFEESVDKIVGVCYAKDLITWKGEPPQTVSQILRPAFFIPETKPLKELLNDFRQNKVHIAIVLDEYGGTAGLVTIEDILEELVGEIADEYEADEPQHWVRLDERTVEVDARMPIDELQSEAGIELPASEDYETVGGFVFSSLGTVPKAGTRFRHGEVEIQVLEAEPRCVRRLRLISEPSTNGH